MDQVVVMPARTPERVASRLGAAVALRVRGAIVVQRVGLGMVSARGAFRPQKGVAPRRLTGNNYATLTRHEGPSRAR